MSEKRPETKNYDLESTLIDWSKIVTKEEVKGRWSFTVEKREVGRKIAFDFAKELDVLYISRGQLENPLPIEDCRLDSNQISFNEYDANHQNNGEIKLVEIFMRHYQDDVEYYNRFMSGINSILEKINPTKS